MSSIVFSWTEMCVNLLHYLAVCGNSLVAINLYPTPNHFMTIMFESKFFESALNLRHRNKISRKYFLETKIFKGKVYLELVF